MEVIYVLLAISISVALLFFGAFAYAVRSGQYDDTYSPAVRILFEERLKKPDPKPTIKTTKSTSTLHGNSTVLLRQQDR